jgi:hypothetical protein
MIVNSLSISGEIKMNATLTFDNSQRWQDRLGRGLMWFAAFGAFSAFASAVPAVTSATSSTVWIETWRMFGFLVFTGMFVLLALRPRNAAGLWELAFFHKAAMAISALFLSGAKDAAMAGTIDGVLAVLIAIAYLLTRGWLAWRK